MPTVDEVLALFERRGDSEYGGEDVTQMQHALQAAALAEAEGAEPELVVAALLHDVGHLVHDLPDDAPDQGIDDHHETAGVNYLRGLFVDAVVEPIRLHVAAKRYLCRGDPLYILGLSIPSVKSLELQGGPMSPEEAEEFDRHPHGEAAVRLRRWDDAAKDPTAVTPSWEHFAKIVRSVAANGAGAGR